MPRDVGFTCKKRQHPDGLHLSSSLPKRLLSVSETDIGSSVDTTSVSPGTAINTPHRSLYDSESSALINSDCSTSIRPPHSSVSLDGVSFGFVHPFFPSDAASSKFKGPGFVLSRAAAASSKLEGAGSMHSPRPCDMASYNLGASNSTKESLVQEGIWTSHSHCEGELSEVTCEKQARIRDPDVVSGSEKATHVISRRDASSLNSKEELWHKAASGHEDYASRGKEWESSSILFSARQKRDNAAFSMVSESTWSCATADSLMEEIRPKHSFSHIYRSVHKELPSNSRTRAQVLARPRLHEIIGSKYDNIIQSSEVILHSSTHNVATEELGPSYVLSSGRMSLEEEARLGRRVPTIDHDFEEYFSSLML